MSMPKILFLIIENTEVLGMAKFLSKRALQRKILFTCPAVLSLLATLLRANWQVTRRNKFPSGSVNSKRNEFLRCR